MTTAVDLIRATDVLLLLQRLPHTDDHAQLVAAVRAALAAGNIPITPTVDPGGPSVIAANTAVYVVAGHTARAVDVRRWLGRAHPTVTELVLVTTRAVLSSGWPDAIAARPLHVVYIRERAADDDIPRCPGCSSPLCEDCGGPLGGR